MIKFSLFLILTVLFSGITVHGDPVRRSLELELEEVEGVKGYEVQVIRTLKDNTKKPPMVFKLKTNKWTANLVPGKYSLSVRSIDARGVPGEWGVPQEFVVKIPAPELRGPTLNEKLFSPDAKVDVVTFKWHKVDGADFYKLKVTDDKDKVLAQQQSRDVEVKIELPVAKMYQWQVTPVFEGSLEGDSSTLQSFELVGAALDKPGKKFIDDFNTISVTWKPAALAEKYAYSLEQKNESGDWKPMETKSLPTAGRKYQGALSTGEYRIKVKSVADHRKDSEELVQEFKTQKLDRSPAAIEQIKSETAYETKSAWFGVASYYVSVINYNGVGTDTGTSASYAAVGGTGRLGLGYWFGESSPWGVQAMADISGFTIGTNNYTYLASILNGVYRYRLGVLGQLRATLGLNYKDLPVTLGDPTDNTKFSQSKMTTLGPIAGVALSHGFSRKLGFQINAAVSPSMMAMSTPNGGGNISKFSYSAGLLGSLKLSEGLVGFAGYAYKVDAGAYEQNLTAATNNAQGGSITTGPNTVEISGHYLNLMLEYGF